MPKVGQREQLENRERECFQFLQEIPMERRYVLIGGYAVSSFQFPRYSVDLDIVIPQRELRFFQGLARRKRFKFKKEYEADKVHHARSIVYYKDIGVKVGLDLMVNAVYSRQTRFAYPFKLLFKHSEVREVRGRSLDARAKARVAHREMLLALKMSSARSQDMRDILALCYEEPETSTVAALLETCPRTEILENLQKLDTYLSTANPDSFRGLFSASSSVLKRSTNNCTNFVTRLMRILKSKPIEMKRTKPRPKSQPR